MKFGVREICDVVLKAKATQKVGNKTFYRGEPVCYFDTLKTSSMEGAATTVYAQGGRGNARLMAWDGERTVTFTMEDALISPEGFMILSGAGLINADKETTIKQHMTETVGKVDALVAGRPGVQLTPDTKIEINLSNKPYFPKSTLDDKSAWAENYTYVMLMKDGEIVSEPFIIDQSKDISGETGDNGVTTYKVSVEGSKYSVARGNAKDYALYPHPDFNQKNFPTDFDAVLVDYYVEKNAGAQQIEITPDKFGGNYYLEASTLFRDTNGVDYPAEFIIPNCKIQSNFTFTMASSGDPSTFTFTMDAFPDYTKFDKSKKVLAAIQIIDQSFGDEYRKSTYHNDEFKSSLEEVSITEGKLGK